jgi:hypothetical protein
MQVAAVQPTGRCAKSTGPKLSDERQCVTGRDECGGPASRLGSVGGGCVGLRANRG